MRRPSEGDTIAAIATPFGQGGLGVVRISGPRALQIAQKIFRPRRPPEGLPSHRPRYGDIIDPRTGEVIDEVLLTYMRAPKTYTREDVVEISGHGGYLVLERILEVVLQQGAREALPGEFTKRAFLSGRIDLAQAEAVLDLIQARSEEALKLAQRQLRGRLSEEVEALKGKVLELLVPVEAWIDMPEEDIPPPSREELRRGAEELLERVEELLQCYHQGEVYREGVRTAILGKANVGKSSLFNRLLGRPRAIVTPLPGTTTDVIEETLVLSGVPFRLLDMAGMGHPRDLVEQEGVKLAREQAKEADLLLLMVDRSRPLDEEDRKLFEEVDRWGRPTLLVINKIDLPAAFSEEAIRGPRTVATFCISALTGEGVKELSEGMVQAVLKGRVRRETAELVPLNLRHKRVLEGVKASLEGLLQGLSGEMEWDLVALQLKDILDRLGEIVGETTPEEVLQKIFSRFCVGK